MTKSQLFIILIAGGITLGVAALFFYFTSQNERSSLAKRTKEINVDVYSLEEAIKWFNANRSDKTHAACILRERVESEAGLHKIKLQHCFLNARKEPLIGVNDPVLIVKTNSIDEDLRTTFGDKKMVVLE